MKKNIVLKIKINKNKENKKDLQAIFFLKNIF